MDRFIKKAFILNFSDAVTHFRPVRICPSRNWEGWYADDCSSDELQESSQESLSVVDKTEDSD